MSRWVARRGNSTWLAVLVIAAVVIALAWPLYWRWLGWMLGLS